MTLKSVAMERPIANIAPQAIEAPSPFLSPYFLNTKNARIPAMNVDDKDPKFLEKAPCVGSAKSAIQINGIKLVNKIKFFIFLFFFLYFNLILLFIKCLIDFTLLPF